MAYTTTKTHYVIGIILLIVILFIGYKYFGWFGNKSNMHKDGDTCMTKDSSGLSVLGNYKNGICVPVSVGPGNNGGSNSSQRTIYMPVNPLNK